MDPSRREALWTGLSAAVGVLTWGSVAAPLMRMPLDPRSAGAVGPWPDWVTGLAEARLAPWEGGSRREIEGLRALNAEYDLMSRTFLALALGDLAVRDPATWHDRAVRALDAMSDDTARQVADRGPRAFSMSYWDHGRTADGRSLFVDGESLLVVAVRRLLDNDPDAAVHARALAAAVAGSMTSGPIGCAESYPDECWTFCNTLALAALELTALVDGDRHAAVRRGWLKSAPGLVDDDTGLLVSSFHRDGRHRDGPEGSSIWLATHMLRLVDGDLAERQYALARAALGRTLLGFGWAREWPVGSETGMDVDSGPIVPVVEASPSSSGLALLAARSFGDDDFADALLSSLDLAAFPVDEGGRERFLASNALGDAVLLAGATAGPLWDLARRTS